MKRTGLWLCAALTLALAACHRPTTSAASAADAPANAAAPTAALQITPTPAAVPAPEPPPSQAVVRTSAARGQSTAAKDARTARHPVAKPRIAHRRSAQDRAQNYSRVSPGHPVIARRDAAGDLGLLPVRSSAGYRSCIAAAHGFTAALGECHNAELARQGARMNQFLSDALATYAGEDVRLQQAQSAWRRGRDAECQAPSSAAIDIQREGACRIDMTAQRADELERLVDDRRHGRG